MARRWLVIINDPQSQIESEEAADRYIRDLVDWELTGLVVELVIRGGIMADKIMGDLVPVRHARMGRGRGAR